MAPKVAHPSDDPRYAALEARINGLEAMIQAVASGAGHFFEAGRESVLSPRPAQPARHLRRVM